MTIHEQEERLFSAWKAANPGFADRFIPDGVVDQDAYAQSPLKVLYILKEVNGGQDWSLKDHLKRGGVAASWNNIARWQYALERAHAEEPVQWNEIERITNDFRKEYLRRIAVVNLKKHPGGSVADGKAIRESASKNRDMLKKQIALYTPDVIVCCGTWDIVWEFDLVEGMGNSWEKLYTGVEFCRKNGRVVFKYRHPNRANAQKTARQLNESYRFILAPF